MRTLPGYGVRAGRRARLDPPSLARELVSTWPDDEVAVILVGHSASCQIVSHAAASRPAGLRGLVLVGPTTDPRAQSWPRLAARWLATATHERPGQVPALSRQYRRTTLRSMARAMDRAREDRIEVPLRQTRCPVLVVRGRHDRICPPDWARSLAPTVSLPAGSHMVPQTHGALVARVLADFASGLAP